MNLLRKEDFIGNENKSFINDKYDIHTAIILNNIGRPIYTFIDGDKDHKKCRFCDRNENEITFNHKAHVIPKFLGNFLVLSNSECDECNSYFSKFETELEKYIKIPLIANKQGNYLKNRYGQNIKRINDDIIVNGKQEIVEFNGLFVLKIFLKFAYSMLYESELKYYNNIKKILLDDKSIPLITNILDITTNDTFDWNSVVLYKKNIDNDKYVDNILSMNFNMKKYIIFFNKDNNKSIINDDTIRENYIRLFNDIDIYNYRIRNLSHNQHIKFNIDVFMELIKNEI